LHTEKIEQSPQRTVISEITGAEIAKKSYVRWLAALRRHRVLRQRRRRTLGHAHLPASEMQRISHSAPPMFAKRFSDFYGI
jgi:hypothetical protein